MKLADLDGRPVLYIDRTDDKPLALRIDRGVQSVDHWIRHMRGAPSEVMDQLLDARLELSKRVAM